MSGSVSAYRASYARDLLLPLITLILSVTLPFQLIVILFLIAGQAHFVMAYWYQWRGGKTDLRYMLTAVTLLVLGVAYFTLSGEAIPLLLAIGVLFSIHFAHDEIMLHGEPRNAPNIIAAVGFSLFFALLVTMFAFPALSGYASWTAIVPVLAFGIRLAVYRGKPSRTEWYLWLIEVIIGVVMVVTGNPDSALAAIVILHVVNWYVGYDSRLVGNTPRRIRYWIEVIAWLSIITALLVVYMHARTPVLDIIFRVRYYYAWAIAHIVLSYVASLPRSPGKWSLT